MASNTVDVYALIALEAIYTSVISIYKASSVWHIAGVAYLYIANAWVYMYEWIFTE